MHLHCFVVLVLCWYWLGLTSSTLTPNFFCSTLGEPEVLLSNGPVLSSNFSYPVTIATDVFFQTPFQLSSTVQVTALVMFARPNNISLTVRAALYNAASVLIAQTATITVSAVELSNVQINPWTLPFDEPVNLTAGVSYSVAYWYAGSSNDGAGYVALFATSPANATWLIPAENFTTTNGSFPSLLAAPYTFGAGTAAPFIQLIGSPCTNTVSASNIHLNETILSILQRIQNKYSGIPAIGASIIQMPSLQSYTGAQSPAHVICPFIPVSTVVTGVRRTDAVTPEVVTVGDKWHLGSDTKSMTAILIQMLIQANKLSLTTTVSDVFPYLPMSPTSTPPSTSCTCANFSNVAGYFAKSPYSCGLSMHISWKYVTVAHLLTHASGIEALETAFLPEHYAEESALERNGSKESCSNYSLPSRRYHLSLLLSMTIPSPPPSINVPVASSYSNNNFILLGLILEEFWSLPWESIIQQQLFDPLGMITAGFGSPTEQVPLNSFATQPLGHYEDAAGILHSTDADNFKAWGPAGTVHASLNDWAKFIACHLQEGRDLMPFGFAPINSSFLNSTTSPYLLSPYMWQNIHTQYVFPLSSTPNSQDSLSGMISNRDNLGLSLWHTGSNTLWYAYVVVYPRLIQPMALLITTNVANDDAVWETKAAIINIYLAWQEQGQPPEIVTSTAASYAIISFEPILVLICIYLFR
ncbi:unnamed protein product [Adineta steineri]|uniref:Beta-lactamase-related domain-containing protein n=1 Tax=Adineta steineri TaxID=433720 RepID=A0A818H067_9BILA|nr:unnamed protein product [Adineta steineri]CAF3496560.1 unnamed protein product [Adineta steineri]